MVIFNTNIKALNIVAYSRRYPEVFRSFTYFNQINVMMAPLHDEAQFLLCHVGLIVVIN